MKLTYRSCPVLRGDKTFCELFPTRVLNKSTKPLTINVESQICYGKEAWTVGLDILFHQCELQDNQK